MILTNECQSCGDLEPETINTISRMTVVPSDDQIKIYDEFVKDIKRSQGLCLNTYSLNQRFVSLHFRAAHTKEIALLDWTENENDSIEVGNIRYVFNQGIGGNGASGYLNMNYSQVEDYFSPKSKFGGWITSDYNNRIIGAQTTNSGSLAYEMTLGLTLGNRHYDSWGSKPELWFGGDNFFLEGIREIVRGGVYNNNGTIGDRTLLYQGDIDYTGSTPNTLRSGFTKKFYALANNRGDVSQVESSPTEANTTGFLKFQFHGSYLINSKTLLIAVEKYLNKI